MLMSGSYQIRYGLLKKFKVCPILWDFVVTSKNLGYESSGSFFYFGKKIIFVIEAI
jgi:hypothetical protein